MKLKPCDKEVYRKGAVVVISNTISASDMDQWVRSLAEESGQRVDWHYVGGRALVKAIGDLDKVRAAALRLLPEHNRLQKKAHDKACPQLAYIPSILIY